jgi:outer membrane protein OmpA-like peptidoglycan-associated protein
MQFLCPLAGQLSRKGVVGMRLARIFCIVLACCLYASSVANAGDCDKAKQLYASATRLLSYEARAKAFQEAVTLCPDFAEAHVNLADAYENLAKEVKDDPKSFNAFLDKAVSEYLAALKINKGLFPAYLGLGDTYRVMGMYEKSEDAYKKALEIKPTHPKAASGFEKIKLIRSQEKAGLKTSRDILGHVAFSTTNTGSGKLMGFEGHTLVRDRMTFNNILFDEWSSELNRQETMQQMEEIGRALSSEELSNCSFVVEGHTDNRGGEERNMRLSWDRADSVKNYLSSHFGITSDRIKTQGFGYCRPRVSNDTPENMQRNRRVEILFVERSDE